MQKQIEFIALGSSGLIGNFKPGDRARVPATLAAHLVDEAKVARYADAPPPAEFKVDAPVRENVEQATRRIRKTKG
ncbi:hypothetical protein ACFFGH_06610 [Lysobacter korlensis]|uniref:Uncharacterized protein n=1 Tax=Lysobacter korlensis TaxID=553636 RepID=A0ABV6RL51_9GAMM